MGNAITVTTGAGFGTAASTTLISSASDRAGFVTFTTAGTIPSSPYLMFTLQWGGSWANTYGNAPVVSVFPCANPNNSRSAGFMGSVSALGPFYTIPNSLFTTTAIYCTNAPGTSSTYDFGYTAVQGP